MKIRKSTQVRAWLSSLAEGLVKKWQGRKTVKYQRESLGLPKNQDIQDIEFKKLGYGYWGTVSQYFSVENRRINVVKKIDKKNYSDKEVNILKRLGNHEHCISMVSEWSDDKYHYIAMEDAGLDIGRLVYRKNRRIGVYKKVNLFARIFKRKEGFTGIDDGKSARLLFKSIFFQSLKGLGHMHKEKLVHRDIKPSNIMITPVGQVRIGDFGCATEVDQSTRFRGDIRYQPPETSRFRRGSYTKKSDIWMLGATMTEMLLGKGAIMIFFGLRPRSFSGIFKRIDKAEGSGVISRDTGALLKSMLADDPADRPSAEELVCSDYFQRDLEALNKLNSSRPKTPPFEN